MRIEWKHVNGGDEKSDHKIENSRDRKVLSEVDKEKKEDNRKLTKESKIKRQKDKEKNRK